MLILGIGSPILISGHPGVVRGICARRVDGVLLPIVTIKLSGGREICVDGPTIERALDNQPV